METAWQDLQVYDAGEPGAGPLGTLGELVAARDPALRHLRLAPNGAVAEWHGHELAPPGETPDWTTPRGHVNWAGLAAELDARRATLAATGCEPATKV